MKKYIAFTLAGILGLAGSIGIMNRGFEKIRNYKSIIPREVLSISEEARDLRVKYGNYDIERFATDPNAFEILKRYKSLRNEQKRYLEDSRVSSAITQDDKGTLMRVVGGIAGAGSGFLFLLGSIPLCGLIGREKKDE